MKNEIITITTEFIRLDALLKLGGALDTGRAGQIRHSKRRSRSKWRSLHHAWAKKCSDGDYAEYNGGRYTVKVEE